MTFLISPAHLLAHWIFIVIFRALLFNLKQNFKSPLRRLLEMRSPLPRASSTNSPLVLLYYLHLHLHVHVHLHLQKNLCFHRYLYQHLLFLTLCLTNCWSVPKRFYDGGWKYARCCTGVRWAWLGLLQRSLLPLWQVGCWLASFFYLADFALLVDC